MRYFPHHLLIDALAHVAAGGVAVWEWVCPRNPRRRVVKLMARDRSALILTARELGVHPDQIIIRRPGQPEQHIVLTRAAAQRAKRACGDAPTGGANPKVEAGPVRE